MHGRANSAPDPGSPRPFWAKLANPRRLVIDDDGYVSSCSYPYPAALDGIPGRVPSYHRLGPLQGLMASRYPGAYASLLHQEGGSCTRTRDEVTRAEARADRSRPKSLPSRTNRTEAVEDGAELPAAVLGAGPLVRGGQAQEQGHLA